MELSRDERNLLSVAFKTAVTSRRSALRSIGQTPHSAAADTKLAVAVQTAYRLQVTSPINIIPCSLLLSAVQWVRLIGAVCVVLCVFSWKVK